MTDEESVLDAVRARCEALVAGDPERLTRLLHAAFTWTSHRGQVFDRASYVTANTRDLVWRSQVLDEPRVSVVGETAVVVGMVRDQVERDGETAHFSMRVTQTWIRLGGQWCCLAGHAGPLAS